MQIRAEPLSLRLTGASGRRGGGNIVTAVRRHLAREKASENWLEKLAWKGALEAN